MSFKQKIINILPDRVVLAMISVKNAPKRHAIFNEISSSGKVRIAFLASSLSMWKSQKLVELLLEDSRFDVRIILTPFTSYDIDVQEIDIKLLRSFFQNNNTPFVDYCFGQEPYNLRKEFNPHIIFFVQTYGNIHCPEHDSLSFSDRLNAYIPYSFWPGNESWGFDLQFHRKAWRIYYANESLLSVAKSFSLIKARNGRVVGYPSADAFITEVHDDVWKIKDKSIKRIIWAPHYTIKSDTGIGDSHSSFLDIHKEMIEYAQSHREQVQIAFKPHPRLKTELYKVWGKEKTDAYYHEWESMPNTQLETGSYVDLFMTSDALIHECGSFMIEYHYSLKPCMYVMEGFEHFYDGMNDLGKKALDLHYKGKNMADVKDFIDKVVFGGDDPLLPERKQFYNSQLLPPNNKTTAQNIYDDLVKSLFK